MRRRRDSRFGSNERAGNGKRRRSGRCWPRGSGGECAVHVHIFRRMPPVGYDSERNIIDGYESGKAMGLGAAGGLVQRARPREHRRAFCLVHIYEVGVKRAYFDMYKML